MARLLIILLIGLTTTNCATHFVEFQGECVIQSWNLLGFEIRRRSICDLPPPSGDDPEVRDREPMNTNPFPGLFERNKADSVDPNLIENTMGYPQEEK